MEAASARMNYAREAQHQAARLYAQAEKSLEDAKQALRAGRTAQTEQDFKDARQAYVAARNENHRAQNRYRNSMAQYEHTRTAYRTAKTDHHQ